MKRPAYQHYVGDWHSDTALQRCSLSSRGLWTEMLGLMHMGIPYGYLTVQLKDTVEGYPLTDLSAWVGRPLDEVAQAFAELESKGIFSRDSVSGHVFSRRMVRDEEIRIKRAEGGKKSVDNPNVPKKRTTSEDILSVEDEVEDERESIDTPLHKRQNLSLAAPIYDAYPRHEGRGKAIASFTKQIYKLACKGYVEYTDRRGESVRENFENEIQAQAFLMESVREFARSPAGNRGEFVPHPATWSNQERYSDDRREWYRDERQTGSNGQATARPNATVARTLNNLSVADSAIQILRDRRAEAGGNGDSPYPPRGTN